MLSITSSSVPGIHSPQGQGLPGHPPTSSKRRRGVAGPPHDPQDFVALDPLEQGHLPPDSDSVTGVCIELSQTKAWTAKYYKKYQLSKYIIKIYYQNYHPGKLQQL